MSNINKESSQLNKNEIELRITKLIEGIAESEKNLSFLETNLEHLKKKDEYYQFLLEKEIERAEKYQSKNWEFENELLIKIKDKSILEKEVLTLEEKMDKLKLELETYQLELETKKNENTIKFVRMEMETNELKEKIKKEFENIENGVELDRDRKLPEDKKEKLEILKAYCKELQIKIQELES